MNTQTNNLNWTTVLDLDEVRIDRAEDSFSPYFRVWRDGKFVGQVAGEGNLSALLSLT